MPTVPVTGDAPRLLRLLVIIAGFSALVLLIACLSWGRTLLIPVALALFLTFLLAPVVTFLQRTGLNRTVAIILVVLCAGISCAGVGWVVMAQVAGLAHDLRYNRLYKQNIKQKLTDLQGISKGGVLDDIQATVNNVMGEIDQDDAASAPANETPVVMREESPPLATLQAALAPVLEPLSAAALVVVLVIFMLLEYEDLRNRLLGLVGSSQLTTTTKALADAGQRISRYLLMQFFINGSYGLAVGAGLFFLGVPYAVLWGFLAALFRYVPYVGPWIAAVFPIIISLVAFHWVDTARFSHRPFPAAGTWEQPDHGALALRPEYRGLASWSAGRNGILDLAVGADRVGVGDSVDGLHYRARPTRPATALLRYPVGRSTSPGSACHLLPTTLGPRPRGGDGTGRGLRSYSCLRISVR